MVETRCATQHLTLSLQDDTAPDSPVYLTAAGLSPSQLPAQHQHQQQQQYHQPHQQQQQHRQQQPQQQQQQVQARLQCEVTIECVVVSVWDDERRRLLGGNAGTGAAPAELCCIYWDNLHLHLTRLPNSGMPTLYLSSVSSKTSFNSILQSLVCAM